MATKNSRRGAAIDLREFIMRHATALETAGHHGTARHYRTLVRNINRAPGCSPWPVGGTGASLVSALYHHLSARGVSRNTLATYLRPLRSILRRASRLGLARYDPEWFGHIFMGVDPTVKRATTRLTLKRLLALDLRHRCALELTRDVFMFSFYCRGMAFVDVAHLTPGNIRGKFLVYTRQKTGGVLRIGLDDRMRQIIDRYAGLSRRYLFPLLKDDSHRAYESALSLYNKHLKTLGALAGIDEKLTSYVARHTWASLASERGIPLRVISAGMGHRSETVTQIYIESVTNATIDRANSLVTAL